MQDLGSLHMPCRILGLCAGNTTPREATFVRQREVMTLLALLATRASTEACATTHSCPAMREAARGMHLIHTRRGSTLVACAGLAQLAESIDSRGVLCLDALSGSQDDDADTGVVAALPHDAACSL